MKRMSITILTLMAFFVLSFGSYAGNQSNQAGVGNVTAVVICEIDDSTVVDEISVEISGDLCPGGLAPSDLATLNCNKGNSCMRCLGELKFAGLTITNANAYVEVEDGEEPAELAYHLLEGNSGPFTERTSVCPD